MTDWETVGQVMILRGGDAIEVSIGDDLAAAEYRVQRRLLEEPEGGKTLKVEITDSIGVSEAVEVG